ncbi:MAG: GspH/FimT family pseudopilin [Candidatus Accumulibacter phosphatis]|jgi:type IV fimbrial biogenesis protein FimT
MHGFSLIELIVGMAILGILMSIGIPAFSDWMRNAKLRTATESVLNGLQLARAEAVRRNARVRFSLVTTIDDTCALANAGPNWVVSVDDPTTGVDKCATPPSDTVAPRIIQIRSGSDGSATTTVAAGQFEYLFTGLGRLSAAPTGVIDVTSSTGDTCIALGGPVRCLRIAVSLGGQIRMCDPALPDGDTQAC